MVIASWLGGRGVPWGTIDTEINPLTLARPVQSSAVTAFVSPLLILATLTHHALLNPLY